MSYDTGVNASQFSWPTWPRELQANRPIEYGWVCPFCKTVYAPSVRQCECWKRAEAAGGPLVEPTITTTGGGAIWIRAEDEKGVTVTWEPDQAVG